MKRHSFVTFIGAILAGLFMACQDSSLLVVNQLQCELLDAPLAIDNTTPHFSWKMSSKQTGAASIAYQILVATELDKLNEQEADLWNTGKVVDESSNGIVYQGKPLATRSLAYWKVRVWNQNDMDFCGHFIYRYPYHDKRGVMNRTFVHNVLSIMTITRERHPHYSGWQAGRRCDSCFGE